MLFFVTFVFFIVYDVLYLAKAFTEDFKLQRELV